MCDHIKGAINGKQIPTSEWQRRENEWEEQPVSTRGLFIVFPRCPKCGEKAVLK